jgi:3-oxoacyl-[acyl-carrier protein] reductase
MLLDGRAAVVTGSATGIGLEIARVFSREGANVVVADLNEPGAKTAAASLDGTGQVLALGCDVTSEDAVTDLVHRTVEAFGGIDIYVNNAGITRDAVMRKMSADDFFTVLRVHLLGAWLGIRAASAAMRAHDTRGSIINMSSISGKVGNPGQTNYSAAKAGMIGLTKAAAKEVARYGIRVNAIQPGLINTAMTAKMPSQVLADRLAEIPLGRLGEVRDVANVALFLASDLSAYMTGTVLEVTGGRHM